MNKKELQRRVAYDIYKWRQENSVELTAIEDHEIAYEFMHDKLQLPLHKWLKKRFNDVPVD